jgi:hypothetical protein
MLSFPIYDRVIRPKILYLKKTMKFNSQSIKYWKMKLKKKIQIYKRAQKIAIKRIRIKIQISNKFYIWLKGEIEKKNQFSKRTQNN